MSDQVIAAVCRLARKKPADIQPHLSLRTLGISSSFGLSALRSLIEAQTGRKLPPIDINTTVADLVTIAGGPVKPIAAPDAAMLPPMQQEAAEQEAAGPPTAPAPVSMPIDMGLGLDLQDIASFPAVRDYRTDPFYAAHFHPSELATAALKPDPRAHLCGLFCAKEAAKKAHPRLLDLRMDELIVTHDPAGRPSLHCVDEALDSAFSFLISITHTDSISAATCIARGPSA